MICPRCGKEYDNTLDCPYCSSFNNTESYNESYSYNSSEITDKDLELFVGYKKSAYYLTKWYNMKMAASSVSWNWPAFLFSSIWMLYRKMYAYGFALLAGNLLLNVILKDTPFDSIFGIAISIASGVLGNKIYNIHVTKKITKIKSVSSDSEMASRRIAYSGGVNIAIPIIFGILAAFLVLLIILGVILAASSLNGFSY
ncbi:DUF2628 domain-containing protein [Clostridium intestinale]|uniref:DUF2628 domain-containing protein n=1 Tax=Clostridium intestinale TaxID=36845 RepID=A0A7D7A4S7_9CLOT|nr:DUF2628 domain-containing protein [Clostridium intestinale]QLY80838.1 DUF2628 domain-containing protein [Clostridium intestinale]